MAAARSVNFKVSNGLVYEVEETSTWHTKGTWRERAHRKICN